MKGGLDEHLRGMERVSRQQGALWAVFLWALTFFLLWGGHWGTVEEPEEERVISARRVREVSVREEVAASGGEKTSGVPVLWELRQVEAAEETEADGPEVGLEVEEMSLEAPDLGEMAEGDFQLEMEEVWEAMGEEIALSELDTAPRLEVRPAFEYPVALMRRGLLEGTVVMELRISADGEPRVLKVLSSEHPLLAEAALRWLRSCRFSEPRYRGQATEARGAWTVTFRAEDR